MAWFDAEVVGYEFGEGGFWVKHLPSAWQALATETRRPGIPSDPTSALITAQARTGTPGASSAFENLCAFWNPLLHLTTFGLGWARSDVGLLKWRQHGYDTQDPILALIRRWWGKKRLDDFAAWAVTSDSHFEGLASTLRQVGHHASKPISRPHDDPGLMALRHQTNWQEIWSPGTDPFHLTFHGQTPAWTASDSIEPPRTAIGPQNTAVLLTHAYAGWYRSLMLCGTERNLAEVDVICRPVGWLGKFQRSGATGLWHRTDESTHLLGN